MKKKKKKHHYKGSWNVETLEFLITDPKQKIGLNKP